MAAVASLCVFCGAQMGRNPAHVEAARSLGSAMARRGITLIYGAGGIGLMGVMADAVLAEGGTVVGVIPESLESLEVAHRELSEKVVTEDMFQRKQVMMDRADAFVVLPGGFGSLDEFFEVLTWKQLGLHDQAGGRPRQRGLLGAAARPPRPRERRGFCAAGNEQSGHGGAVDGRAVPRPRQWRALSEAPGSGSILPPVTLTGRTNLIWCARPAPAAHPRPPGPRSQPIPGDCFGWRKSRSPTPSSISTATR